MRALLISLCAAVVLLGGCATGEFAAYDGPPLRVGVSPNYPPVIFEHNGTIVGIEADLARRTGHALQRPIEFVRIPFPDLLLSLIHI